MAVIFTSMLADIAVAVATCFLGMYLYFMNAFRYWKRRGVHYVPPKSFLGNLGGVVLQWQNLAECLKIVYDNNPTQPVVGLFAGTKPFLMIRDLNVVRSVMVKDAHAFLDRSIQPSAKSDRLFTKSLFVLKGKQWRHMRIKLTPTFTSGKIKNMFYLINECGKQLLPCIEQEISKGKGFAVKDTISRYSMDVIASCAFGVNANSLTDPNCEFRTKLRKMTERGKWRKALTSVSVIAPWLVKLFQMRIFDESVNTYVRKTFWDVADYRKKNHVVRKDFVDILMQMKDEGEVRAESANDLDEIKQDSKYMNIVHNHGDKLDIKLDDDDFVAQAFIFIVAGFETSASVISFTLYELALNPRIQDKLRREIQAVLDKHNAAVTYDSIAEMEYLEMVVSETLRLHPTLPTLERKCLQDYQIPDTDITIEKGTSVMIPLLAIHHDPAIYPEPEKFDPERFSPENKNKRSNFTFMPFGEGPRICIGMRFGQMQVKTALVHILTTFKVNTCAETPQPPLDMKPAGLVNNPKQNIVLTFEKI